MTQRTSKLIKMGLSLLLLAAVTAIVWNFVSRQRLGGDLADIDLLSPQISRHATEFEYEENKEGRTVFKVRAETSTESATGLHTLKNVDLIHYDGSGQPTDAVSGHQALYEIAKKSVDFNGDVLIQLGDGTRVFSKQVEADLNQRVIEIDQEFRFQRGLATGNGESLHYDIPKRMVEVRGKFELAIESPSGSIQVEALEATYYLNDQFLDLVGSAEIVDPQRRLSSDRMKLFLTEDRQIKNIFATGNARFVAESSQKFNGDQINIFFDDKSHELEYFEVVGEAQDSSSRYRRAVYEEGGNGNTIHMEARKIIGRGREGSLSQLEAVGNVFLRSSSLGIEEGHAHQLTGHFWPGEDNLRRLELQGQVFIVKSGSENPLQKERLRSNFLGIDFNRQGLFHRAVARGNVDLELRSGEEYRRLFSKESVEAFYNNGKLERLVGSTDAFLESVDKDEKRVLHAAVIEALYENGELHTLSAQGGVALALQEAKGARYSTSQSLVVTYRGGEIASAVQTGDFHYWVTGETGAAFDAWSEKASYDPARETVSLQGKDPPLVRTRSSDGVASETSAGQISLRRDGGHVLASGRVHTVLREREGPIIITAGHMETDGGTGWIRYWNNPRMIQDDNSVTGKVIRFNNQEQYLTVEGEVKSLLVQPGERADSIRKYSITANRLVYDRRQNKARYEEQVRLRSQELQVDAPVMEVLFSSKGAYQPQSIVASGGVKIKDKSRQAQGDQAVYQPSEGKITITGDRAQVTDEKGVKASGRRLTFQMGDEKLAIEAPAQVQPEKP
ncbi:MAG: LPS export ABC transporter periplasmic protein LptC [Acidobacteriota bacterium]